MSGTACHFPYTYKGVTYHVLIMVNVVQGSVQPVRLPVLPILPKAISKVISKETFQQNLEEKILNDRKSSYYSCMFFSVLA